MALLVTANKKYACNGAFVNVISEVFISKVFISIVKVSLNYLFRLRGSPGLCAIKHNGFVIDKVHGKLVCLYKLMDVSDKEKTILFVNLFKGA